MYKHTITLIPVCTQVTRFLNFKQVGNSEPGLAFSLNILLERTQSINSQLRVTRKELREELAALNQDLLGKGELAVAT